MDHQLSQLEEHSSHPRNSIPSEAKGENSQQGKQQDDHGGRPPSDKFTLKTQLCILAVLLYASIISGDFRSAVLNAFVSYVIVYVLDHLRNVLDHLRKAVKK